MKKILFISPRPPYPLTDGGRIRAFQSLYFLSKIYNVDILYITEENDSSKVEKGIKDYCNNIYSFKISKYQRLVKAIIGLAQSNIPIRNMMLYSKSIQKWIDENINQYDAVYCQTLRTVNYVMRNKEIKKYVDFVDAVSMNYEKAVKKSTGLHSLYYKIDFKRLCKFEEYVLSEIDNCSIISVVDKQYISNRMKKEVNLHVVGNMAKVEKEIVQPSLANNVIVFVGKMSYEPNIVAVTNFVENIFPNLKKRIPTLKFYIVGASPTKQIKKLQTNDVIVTGFVESLYDYYKMAAIVIAPMLTGAGIQNKIIQAMSLGSCVVTTSIGAEGISNCKEGLVVTDGNNNIENKIYDLLTNPLMRDKIGIEARKYIQNIMNEKYIFNQFLKFIGHEERI